MKQLEPDRTAQVRLKKIIGHISFAISQLVISRATRYRVVVLTASSLTMSSCRKQSPPDKWQMIYDQ